jgi:hypothetical protein
MAKKRVGRPPKSPEDRKTVNFTFRSRGQMRELLQAAATASGRSISEEIEHRLEASFQKDNTADIAVAAASEAINRFRKEFVKPFLHESGSWRPGPALPLHPGLPTDKGGKS